LLVNWKDPITVAGQSDTGMRRSNNQDSYAIVQASNPDLWRQRGHVFMVADGMGAHAVGEMASKMACENIPHNYAKARNLGPADAVVRAYHEVGSLIHSKASANREFQGMGTTCSTLLLLPAGALIAHVGDSRIYRVRRGRIEQLTFDHSLVWELVRHKHLTPEQASKAIPRNVITRSLGPDPVVEVDLEGPYPLEPGDVFLLCSDGLSGPVPDPDLGTFASYFHPEQACRYLLHLANLRGGPDNITVVIVRIGDWTEPGQAPPGASDAALPVNPAAKGFRLSQIFAPFQRRESKPPAIEEHIYQAAECVIDEALLTRISEEVRAVQSTAIEQSWALDWSELARHRREAEECRSRGQDRAALSHLGECVVILGQAGRVFRKEHGPNGSH
jgi:protein phosphatase